MLLFCRARVCVPACLRDVSIESFVSLRNRSIKCLSHGNVIHFELVSLDVQQKPFSLSLDDSLFHFGVSKLTFVIMVLSIDIQEICVLF